MLTREDFLSESKVTLFWYFNEVALLQNHSQSEDNSPIKQ